MADGGRIAASGPSEFVRLLREGSWFDSGCTDGEYMVNFSGRYRELHGVTVRTDTPEHFMGPDGMGLLALVHPDDRAHVSETLENALRKKEPFELTYRIITSWNEEKWVWEQGAGVHAGGAGEQAPLLVEGFINDVTEKQKQDNTIRQENEELRERLKARCSGDIVGNSPQITAVFDLIAKAAAVDDNVVVYGESGTGKELAARAIHDGSSRYQQPFVAVNCGAIPESLMESELFGYEPGAFSGANSGGQKGLLEQAHTGTFFLDEVSEMPVSLQVKLLRVLQERVVRRVGGKVNHSVDIRIIAASNRNLRELVAQGAFREDLFFRLDVIPLFVPPLRERQGDIRLLVAHFLQSFSRERGCTYRVATELMHAFEAYPWPGNVRELKNFVEYGVGFCEHGVLTLDLMDSRFKTASPPPVKTEKGMPSPPPEPARDTAEYDRIMQLLERYGQHTEGKKRTASELGISLATLYRRMGQLGITARKHAR